MPNNPWHKNILDNLRQQYGEKIAYLSDTEVLARFDDWNVSDKTEDCLTWLVD